MLPYIVHTRAAVPRTIHIGQNSNIPTNNVIVYATYLKKTAAHTSQLVSVLNILLNFGPTRCTT